MVESTQNQQPTEKKGETEANQQPANVNPEETKNAASEETKNELNTIIKGMRQIECKNIVVNFESRKQTWESLKVPQEIVDGLTKMSYFKPSII